MESHTHKWEIIDETQHLRTGNIFNIFGAADFTPKKKYVSRCSECGEMKKEVY